MDIKREKCLASIVLLGKFRPDDFRPKRLAESNVISKYDASGSEITGLIAGQMAHFTVPWATFLIAKDRFQISTSDVPFIRICDCVRKAFSELDTSYSISALGINFEGHYDVGDFRVRDSVGRAVAPPGAWGAWGDKMAQSMNAEPGKESVHGGVVSLTLRLPFITDFGLRGWRDVTIQPSFILEGGKGIFLTSNHHHFLDGNNPLDTAPENKSAGQDSEDADMIFEYLGKNFDTSLAEAEAIFRGVLER